ncbi:hypothetical protein [Prochlorothrix hollandica]|uniref:DUF2281 domain-containing protein n=1 Tax=Prochlorothrix hollandica PCC 9006 = CALU 1027 TaxID=317619 RepID=A0A0M2Q156_PROHO|nr:hypothetical protein [Prochlorothrix hollandica]KKJ00694.1 hypothetical protein PROH_05255 [Prochlorothrix hollandica PCC 9006 = CALU 1027]
MTPAPTTTPADPIAPADPNAATPAPVTIVKAQLLDAIDRAPDSILIQVLNFLNFLLSPYHSPTQSSGITIESQGVAASKSQWSPEFLSTFGAWEGELERNQPQWGRTEEVETLDIEESPA